MSALVQVGRYTRDLGASIERLIENALDWEHLPHTHASSFTGLRVLEHGATGWRAEAMLANRRSVTIHLQLTDDGWVTRTATNGRLAAEIRTVATSTGPASCRVDVHFFVESPPVGQEASIGANYERLYADLYDEDQRLMIARAEAISRGPAALKVRRPIRLADGTSVEAPVFCPHQGLPLDAEPDENGVITCPWHGYRIDIRTGRCTPPAQILR